MKEPSVVFLLITLLLAVAHGNEPVYDSAGNPVEFGKKYFIQPVNGNGGGLVPAATKIGFDYCPLGIVQALLSFLPGQPVGFSLANGGEGSTVMTSLDLNIEFRSFLPVCTQFSKLWEVDDSPSAQKEPSVLIGGKSGDRNSRFEIEKAGDGAYTYKLTTFYGTVGTKPSSIPFYFGAQQLIITNDTAKTVLVKFKKVDDATTATTSTSRVDKLGIRMFPFY